MADTLDILTLAEGHAAINLDVSSTSHDPELAQHITAVSRLIDAECGPVVNRTVTAEVHSGGVLYTKYAPLVSVSLVRENKAGTLTTHSAVAFGGTTIGYYIDPSLTGRIYYASGGQFFDWPHTSQVEVTYIAGRAANTAAVDHRFKVCAASVLRRLWKRESGTWAQSSSFFEDATPGVSDIGFFRVAKPVIDEMLNDQIRRDVPVA